MQSARLFAAFVVGALLTACSGIPGSGPVHEVTKVADQVNQDSPATPDAGMTPDAIVRGFILLRSPDLACGCGRDGLRRPGGVL